MTKAPSLDLWCLGEPLVEFNQTDPARPDYQMGFGGDTSNCAIAAARQGCRVGYLTRLGDDPFAHGLLALWAQEGVDTEGLVRDAEGWTGIYFVSHGPAGHEFSYRRAGSASSQLQPGQLEPARITGARVLHASGISLAISASAADAVFEAMTAMREAGRLVSFDTNLRLRLWPLARARALSHEAVRIADLLLPGLEDASALLGIDDPDAIVDRYLAMGPKIVALTLGAKGALIATADHRQRLEPWPVTAVDATGAGDAFDGAFIAEYLRTGDPFAAGAFGNAAAALATTGWGAVAPLPTRAEVERFIARADAGR